MNNFSEFFRILIHQSNLSLRRLAAEVNIPHQTLYNWTNGTTPRWHPALRADLLRISQILRLSEEEISTLLILTGCISTRTMARYTREVDMEQTVRAPEGWFVTGSHPSFYTVEPDSSRFYSGQRCIRISATEMAQGFGTLMQEFQADDYRLKQLQFSAVLRTEGVNNWAGLWIRADADDGTPLAFEGMDNYPIRADSEWSLYTLTLNIPLEAGIIAFGIVLTGPGTVWVTQVKLEIIMPMQRVDKLNLPTHPVNLSFEE